MTTDPTHLAAKIREIPDFPKPGVVFKDITPLMQDPQAFREVIDRVVEHFKGARIDQVLGIESRGFIFGAAIAYALGAGFVPVRKAGKLPAPTHSCEYALEYGTDVLEIHCDAVRPGERVLIIDDVLATGGTAAAVLELVRKLEGEVAGFSFLIELSFLSGRDKLQGHETYSVLRY
ncbi:adenine phosphoribosyltransferase [bacterium]|nr:adenine phosphoribosyltransferase [bacterium]